jgi:hypothetical protein
MAALPIRGSLTRTTWQECFSKHLHILLDEVPLSAYRYYEIDAPAALHKVMIAKPGRPDDREDIAALSEVVHAIPDGRLCRVYACDEGKMLALKSLWQEVVG